MKDTATMAELAEEWGLNHAEVLEYMEQLQTEGLAVRLVDEVTGKGVWFATATLAELAKSPRG